LFGTGKFFYARELRPPEGAESNSSDKSESNKILLESEMVGLVLSLKFPMFLTN